MSVLSLFLLCFSSFHFAYNCRFSALPFFWHSLFILTHTEIGRQRTPPRHLNEIREKRKADENQEKAIAQEGGVDIQQTKNIVYPTDTAANKCAQSQLLQYQNDLLHTALD